MKDAVWLMPSSSLVKVLGAVSHASETLKEAIEMAREAEGPTGMRLELAKTAAELDQLATLIAASLRQ